MTQPSIDRILKETTMTTPPGTNWTGYNDPDPWRSDIGKALLAADLEDNAEQRPDGVWIARRSDGAFVSFGDDGQDEDGQQWWTATFNRPNEFESADSWTDLNEMIEAITKFMAA